MKDGRELARFEHGLYVRSADYIDRSCRQFASGGGERKIRLWDVERPDGTLEQNETT